MHGNYAAQQYSQAQQPKAPREYVNPRDRDTEPAYEVAGGALGGAALVETAKAAVPRAMEAQAFAGKHLAEAVHELLARLEPVLGPELAKAAGQGQGGQGTSCALASLLDRNTAEVQGATDTLRSILRRLAL